MISSGLEKGSWITTAYGVRGHLMPGDVESILGVVNTFQPKVYAEIGTYLGCSACMVAKASPTTLVYAHDLWEEDMKNLPEGSHPPHYVPDYFIEFYNNVRRLGLERQVIPVRGDSKYSMKIHPDDSVDLAFVDGDHSLEGCLADLRECWRCVRPGGLIMVHDCYTGSEVVQALEKFGEPVQQVLNAGNQPTCIRVLKKPNHR
jgi:predicted O-methyltransferase YrrM